MNVSERAPQDMGVTPGAEQPDAHTSPLRFLQRLIPYLLLALFDRNGIVVGHAH